MPCHSEGKVSFPCSPSVPWLPEGLGPWVPGVALSPSTSVGVDALSHELPPSMSKLPFVSMASRPWASSLWGLLSFRFSVPSMQATPRQLWSHPCSLTESALPRLPAFACAIHSARDANSILHLSKLPSPFQTSPRWRLTEDPLSPSQSLSSVQ